MRPLALTPSAVRLESHIAAEDRFVRTDFRSHRARLAARQVADFERNKGLLKISIRFFTLRGVAQPG